MRQEQERDGDACHGELLAFTGGDRSLFRLALAKLLLLQAY